MLPPTRATFWDWWRVRKPKYRVSIVSDRAAPTACLHSTPWRGRCGAGRLREGAGATMPAGRRVPAPGALASTLGVGCLVDAAARRAGYPRAGVPQGQGRGSRARGSEGQQGGTHPAVAPPDRARLLLSPRQFGGGATHCSGLFSKCLAQPVRAAGSRCARAPQARAPASCSVRRARLGGGAVLFWWWRARGCNACLGTAHLGGLLGPPPSALARVPIISTQQGQATWDIHAAS